MMVSNDKANLHLMENDIKLWSAEIGRLIDEYRELNKNDQKAMARLQEFVSVRNEYRKTREEQFSLIYKGKIDEARQLGIGIQDERYKKMSDIAVELGKRETEQARQRIAQSEQTARYSTLIFIIAGIAALLFSVVASIALSKAIGDPLKEITEIAEKLAVGELRVRIPAADREDEVGALLRAFRRMVANIGKMAGMSKRIALGDLTPRIAPASSGDIMGNALASMVNGLRQITTEIKEGVNILAASAGEILASTSQVASSAAQTASAVNETTATVEEVKQTTELSVQKARYVSDSSQKSLDVSRNGRKSVEEAVQKMSRIREQMETIGESIVNLSEQSQAIGEIIATVNDLAEQSNLLAVNAAIEAAKAGEHGKGFAVVAQEVKSLAEQSKQATAQVRTILNDIQKATNAAVMATEQGSKAVEAGEKQSAEAGESIRTLADSIAESANAAAQIGATSQQQMVGMDQVVLAMESIREASNLSVTGTQQAEQSAQNLNELGQRLKGLVEKFKL
jgi:methyl-accepting chemotaxis protein